MSKVFTTCLLLALLVGFHSTAPSDPPPADTGEYRALPLPENMRPGVLPVTPASASSAVGQPPSLGAVIDERVLEIQEIQQQRLSELNQLFRQAATQEEALMIQRHIHDTKLGVEIQILKLQLEYVLEYGPHDKVDVVQKALAGARGFLSDSPTMNGKETRQSDAGGLVR